MPDQSALVVPIAEASAVNGLRLQFDSSAAAGMPEHVTLLFPFVEPQAIDDAVLGRIQATISGHAAFPVTFEKVNAFEGGTLYLEPSPSLPFIALINVLVRRFRLQPYGGSFATVTPHLTIGQQLNTAAAGQVRKEVSGLLPIAAVAAEVWLVVGSNETQWLRRATFGLGPRY